MGNIFESNPTVLGEKEDLSNEEQEYFNRVNSLLHKDYRENLYSDYNLEVSLEQKSFENNQMIKMKLEDISWLEYIYRHLDNVNRKYRNPRWVADLQNSLSKEIFFYENKYYSNFFYNEYYFTTSPRILEENYNGDLNNISLDYHNHSLSDLNHSINNNAYNELDVTDNYGGSYLEMNMENLDPNDPTFQYKMKRKNLKKYVKIFKEHIYNNHQHPINRVVFLFNKYFCNYINTFIENTNNQLKQQLLEGENYKNSITQFENEITQCLRDFMTAMHCSLKLFYSTCINYACFEEEKDDIINLLTSLFFKTGKLYETIFSLYSISFEHEIEELQEKFNDLKNVKPKELGVQIKFCLDEDTLELQTNILKDKQIERDQKENEDKKKEIINLEDEKKIIKKDNNELFQIKENEEEEKENENEDENDKNNKINNNINIAKKSIDINMNNFNNLNNLNDINDLNEINELNIDKDEDDYLLEKVNDDISIDIKMDPISGGLIHLRNTVNSFNSKKYLFPKIRQNLRDTLALNDKYIKEAKASGKMPIPFSSAINLLKNLKHYKTPFEKIVILAALSDQITESVSNFWSNMMNYIKNSFLFIEADEIMAIFVFIVIKAQMPDLLIESKIISNFTTPSTRAFNISYNLTLMEASLETINKMDSKEIANREKQLKEVRKSIAVLTTQRLSRLSRLSNPGNPLT